MLAPPQERVGIVGLGAIGGSLALALRQRTRVLAWSREAADREGARQAGISLCAGDDGGWSDEIAGSSMVILAVPLDEVAGVTRQLLPRVPDECLLLHTASLQRRETLGVDDHEFRRLLGAHPIAGSERSGFLAAHTAMFRGATLRAESRAAPPERRRIEWLWNTVEGGPIAWTDAASHDTLMSWVSHLPQLTATALAAVLADRGLADVDTGPGARDTTRLAASELRMWEPILRAAPPETVDALARLTRTLEALRLAIDARDHSTLRSIWDLGRAWRSRTEEPA